MPVSYEAELRVHTFTLHLHAMWHHRGNAEEATVKSPMIKARNRRIRGDSREGKVLRMCIRAVKQIRNL